MAVPVSSKNWAPASAIVSSQLEWQEEAVRLLIPVADEGSYCGSPVNDFDIESVYFARQLAAQNDVVISPLVPVIAPDPVRAMAELITVGTGGISTVADFDLEDVLPVARAIAVSACGTAETISGPAVHRPVARPGVAVAVWRAAGVERPGAAGQSIPSGTRGRGQWSALIGA